MNENDATPHAIEPELLQVAPRRVKRRGFSTIPLIFLRVFMMPHTIIGAGLMIVAIASTLVFFLGSNTLAQVTARNVSRGKNTTYKIYYQYREAGALRSESQDVSVTDYNATPVGAALQVRRLAPLPFRQFEMASGKRYPPLLFIWGFALFWNGIVSVFFYLAWVAPWQRKKLVAQGAETQGRIAGKEITRQRHTSYKLIYRYTPREYSQTEPFATDTASVSTASPFESASAISRAPLQGKMTVSKTDFDAAHEGDFVTILYDAHKPQRSLIYRYAEYQCIP